MSAWAIVWMSMNSSVNIPRPEPTTHTISVVGYYEGLNTLGNLWLDGPLHKVLVTKLDEDAFAPDLYRRQPIDIRAEGKRL